MRKAFGICLTALLLFQALLAPQPLAAAPAAPTTVFINEIHYDNDGTDSGEAIEIAGPASTDLTGWSLVLYNGNNGAAYDTDDLSGTIPDQQNGYGTVVMSYPANGIQNGAPDGLALVDASNTVIQFLSYEGTFTAVGGPADGMTSVDIGVSEPGTAPVGTSLQLSGTGTTYEDFTWNASTAQTFGAVNTGQTFPAPQALAPVINEFSASTAGDDVEFVEIYGSPDTNYSAYTVLEIEGDSGSAIGTVDEVIAVGTTGAGGLWLADLAANTLENGTITLLLVKDFTGALTNDLDTDNDGVLDVTPWSELVDSVAVNDGGAGDITFGVPTLVVGYDGASFAPGGASRIPDGTDTDTAADWVRNDFDKAGITGFVGTPVVGEAYNTPGAPNQVVTVVDTAPTVASTNPAAGATGVALDASLAVTFSEDVAVTGTWYDITCSTSGAHTAAVSGGPAAYILDPDADFAYSESCTVTIYAAQVTDLDGTADNMAADYSWGFETAAPAGPVAIINELDADTVSTDTAEFIELYDGGAGNTSLDGLALVLYNGSTDVSYNAFDLDGRSTDAAGYFVLCGNAANVPNCHLDVTPDTDLIQNGQDAVALYQADASSFPNGTAVTTANLIDAIVYDTSDADDPGLLVLLNAGQPQVDENANAAGTLESNQRCPNGSGGARNTETYGQWLPTPGALNVCGADLPPTVASTNPASGATGVAANSDVTVTFSEPVTATGSWYQISCATSGAHTAVVTGGPTTWTLNPDADFSAGEACTVTIYAAQVADQDDPPDAMAADYVWSFTVAEADICENPFTPIYTVQGNGAASPLVGTVGVAIEGIVVGDFQGTTGLNGFYVQDAAGDADVLTSDGVFVYVPAANALSGIDVAVGDAVHLVGTVKEYNGVTQMDSLTALKICGTGSVAATVVELPELVNDDLERFEGMLVTFPETLTVSQNYFQGRYGQVTLSSEGRMYNPTNGNGLGDTFELNARRMLVLDDGYSGQNPSPIPYIGADDTLRAGDTVAGLTGTLDYGPINSTSPYIYDYRLQPTQPVSFTRVNARTAAPAAVGGNVTVASFNVLNYFTTFGSRGATNLEEFVRQRTKIIAALVAIDADVVGLMEIENNGATAVGDLVAGLNAAMGAGTYAYVTEPAPGADEIKVAMIYKPAAVAPLGATQNYQTSTATYSPLYDRPPLAQTFTVAATGETFTVMVNHFKSKGSCPAEGVDTDQGDGQGCWNAKRVAQATGLLDFISQLQASAGDPDVLVIGDLNAYGIEDPVKVLTDAGLIDEVALVPGASRYTYTFDGFSGYLDHGLVTPSVAAQVTGRTLWHINTDEPSVIDYNLEFKPQDLYTPTPYRSSDHDPVILGLGLYADLGDLPATYGEASHTGQGALRLGALWTGDATSVPGGDDASDDGVRPVAGFNWTADQGGKVSVTVAGGPGYLSGWANWNGDGVFDPTEALFTNQAVAAGPDQELAFAIPQGVTVSGSYWLRFRLYPAAQEDPPADPVGPAAGGEVEDYAWGFGPNAVGLLNLQATAAGPTGWPALGYGGLALLALLGARRRK